MKSPAIFKTRRTPIPLSKRRIVVQTPDGDYFVRLYLRNPNRSSWSCAFRFNGKLRRHSCRAVTLEGAKDGARAWIADYRRSVGKIRQAEAVGVQLLLDTPPPQTQTQFPFSNPQPTDQVTP